MRAIKILKYCVFLLLLVAIIAKADPAPDKDHPVTSRYDADGKHLHVNRVLNIKKSLEALRRIPSLLKKFVKKHTGKKSKGSGKNDNDNNPFPPIGPAPVPPAPKITNRRPRPASQPAHTFPLKKPNVK